MTGDPLSEPIHLLDDGPTDPAWNMAVDDALLHLKQSGELAGTWVRLFGWLPPAVSIGRLQSPGEELDLEALAEEAVPIVRRSTGGKAVYHANELTYSVVGAVPDPTWGENLHETYRRVTAVIASALERIGVATALAPRRPRRGGTKVASDPLTPGRDLAAACFAVAFGHELVHEGRKICGSAQRRLTRAFLQHGSLLLGPEHARLAHFLRVGGDREQLMARLARDTIDVAAAAGRPVDLNEAAGAVRDALAARFGERLVRVELPSAAARKADQLLAAVRVGLDAAVGPGLPGSRAERPS